jgi:calcium release-activated calcium channel protein 1
MLQQQWREQDLLQRHLDNARVLWARAVEKNRRDVEEKSEQLKAVSALAALIAGFSLSAFLQFDFGTYVDSSGVMFPLFGVTMALTVGGSGDAGQAVMGVACGCGGCGGGCGFL